ncbi:hypothetical protein DRO69_00375 [Candidatus Bathyarchaeota archaeon]|nr:MAG: hypothetical protein DRO69_00375 [Candidatus Bathyarchaeota archaeon]
MGIDYDWILVSEEPEITDPKGFVEFLKSVGDCFREIVNYNFVYEDVDELTARKKWAFLGFKGPYEHGPHYRIPRMHPEDEELKRFLEDLSKYMERCEFIVISEEFPYVENAIWKVILNKGEAKIIPLTLCPEKEDNST